MSEKTESKHPAGQQWTCTDCFALNCYRREKKYPDRCATRSAEPAEIDDVTNLYKGDTLDARIAHAAAEVEGRYYGRLTRVEEIIAFARRVGVRRLGIATCLGLVEEARVFAKVLESRGFLWQSVVCKVGSVDKSNIGIPNDLKIAPDKHEAICNPILQARLLNDGQTELNVTVGLCVGHDALFNKYSKAPVTTLITKDRVLGHNPAAALYTSGCYYKRLFDNQGL